MHYCTAGLCAGRQTFHHPVISFSVSCPIDPSGDDRAGDGARKLRQDRLEAPDHRLEQADAAAERAVHIGLDRALAVQVDDAPYGLTFPAAARTLPVAMVPSVEP